MGHNRAQMMDEIIEHNNRYVEQKKYERYETTKFPDKKMVILTYLQEVAADVKRRVSQ